MTGRAERLKIEGNEYFKAAQYDQAKRHYMDALMAGREEGAEQIMHTIYGNLAHVNNKLGAYKESEKYARLAIRKKPDWYKGYHRAALAAKNLGRLDDAIALVEKGIDNCVTNDELKTLRDTLIKEREKARGASKPPPPPPLLKADQPAAASRAASTTRAPKTGKTAKASKATKAAAPAPSRAEGLWSSALAASKPAMTVSEQTAAAARAGQPDALTEELCITVRRGSVALQRPGGAREAFDEYRKALHQVAKYGRELNLSGNELISLRYCYAMACHEVATLDALNSAEEELLAIIQKTKRPMPAAFYLLGKVYMRLNRFDQAATVLQMASDILSRDARGDTHVFPGTSEVIPDTESAWRGTLRQPVAHLLRQCRYPPRADALCRLEECLSRVNVPDVRGAGQPRQQTRRAIYYRDVDFAGFIQVQCLFKCRLEYHLACWRQLKERFGPETQRTTDKDLLNTPCLTPDCDSSICRIVTIDANGLEKHELLSDEYKRQQQKQPQKQISKQQKKQQAAAAQAQKKHQPGKARKKESAPPQASQEEGDTQRHSGEPPPPAAAAGAVGGAAPEAAAAPPPDLREMTVLRKDSLTDEVPVGKKSRKKKKGSSSRLRGRRPTTEAFWETPEVEEEYRGPPVNVIYNTSAADLATRLGQLQDMRTLQFSTRSLIPDSSVQPASVPREDHTDEETHAVIESAYQFLYDYIKGRGPTPVSDPGLLSLASDLPGPCQRLIAQYGSLETFLTRLPRFYLLDDLLCVEVDVAVAEAMLGSVISDRIREVTPARPSVPPPPQPPAAAEEGVSDADTAELEPRSDPEESESESESEEATQDSGSASYPNGTVYKRPPDVGETDPDLDPDSEIAEPELTEPEPEPDSAGLDGDSAGAAPEDGAGAVDGAGARGDGAWNTDMGLSDDGEDFRDSVSQSEPSEETASVAQLRQMIETLKREKSEQAEQLSEARISQLRMERSLRQLSQRAGSPPAAPQQQQLLVELRQQLAETQGRLVQADQLRTAADQLRMTAERQLSAEQQQLLGVQQQLAETEGQLLGAQQQLAVYQQQLQQVELQNSQQLQQQQQHYEAQLAEERRRQAELEQRVEKIHSKLSQLPERLQQTQQQLQEAEAGRGAAETALTELRAAERRSRAQYVNMLSKAGTVYLDAVAGRCSDAVTSAERLASSSGRPDSALPTVAALREASAALELTRTQFKETIKKACKAIASKEAIDLQSLKLPQIPDIVDTVLSGPSVHGATRSSPANSVRSGASPRPNSRPSSVVTVSSGSGSETGRMSPPPPPPPPLAAASASLRAASPRRPVTPAALQLSAASRQAAPTTFDTLVSEIERQLGGAAPGGREAIMRELTNYRRRRGGALRGAAREQIVAEITAVLREAAPAPGKETANGLRSKAAGGSAPPPLASLPSKEECVICREPYPVSQARRLECGHQFHELCLRRWQANGVMATCPICRHPYTSDNDFPRL